LSPSPAPDVAITPSLGNRVLGGFGTSILGGAALGIAAWWTDQLGFPWNAFIPVNAIGAWLGVAFILGATARTRPTGALRGLIGLLSAVAAYYLLIGLLGAGFRAIGASHAASIWGAVGLLAGPVFGFAGATWRHGNGWPRAISVGLLAGALIAEGLAYGTQRWERPDRLATDPGAFILAAEAALGLLLPWVLLRRGERRAGYVSTIVLGAIAALAIGPLIAVLRALADTF
jgi:Family of unknown function (DUF6518)